MTSEQLPRHEQLTLAWGFSFEQLQDAQGLQNLEQRFVQYLGELDPDIQNAYHTFRYDPEAMSDQEYARWIIRMGPWVEGFVVKLFNLDLAGLHHSYHRVEDMLWFRKHMVLPVMRKNYQLQSALPTYADLESWMFAVLTKEQIEEKTLIAYAKQMDESQDLEAIKRIQDWCFLCLSHPESHTSILSWPSFWVPKKRSTRLVEVDCDEDGTTIQSKHISAYQREDFQFLDTYLDKPNTALQSDYCSFCHDKEVDYCRKGFLQSKKKPDLGFRKSDEGAVLSGCPLDEKISEMHWLKHNHYHLAALVAVMIDNPMCPATGHRICNDCIMSCIYQKQEGVDTPQVETGVLMDILKLPWGVEVYDLLVKWNPLRRVEFCPLSPTGQRVLVMGLGPSGFSLMHHLWMRGITVMGVDGASLSLAKPYGLNHPVYDYQSLWQCLSERRSMGFGGVSEYGITVRWDKNFLQLIYLSLSRRQRIGMAGNVRFGGGLRVEDAWRLGFDHLALALGAGLPQALAIPNSLAKGMCQANDFLMSLQLTGAQHTANLASLSMHMPCVVIGGGLTAVDAATEAQAFYLQFIKMIYLRIDALLTHKIKQDFWQAFSEEERGQLEIWYEHGKAMLAYRKKALASGQTIDYSDLLQSWGGVSILYRGALERAPSYRQNASELQAALDQGVSFLAHTTPLAVDIDNAGQVMGLFVTQPWQGEVVCFSEIKVNLVEVAPEYVSWTQESELDQLAEGMVFVGHLDFSGDVYLRVVGVDQERFKPASCLILPKHQCNRCLLGLRSLCVDPIDC